MKKNLMLLAVLAASVVSCMNAAPLKKEYTRKIIQVPAKKTTETTKTPIKTTYNRNIAHSIDAIRKAVAQNSAKNRAPKTTARSPRVITAAATPAKIAPAKKAQAKIAPAAKA